MAGGDYHALKVAQQWSQTDRLTYLLPRLGYSYVTKAGLLAGNAVVIDSFLERETSSIVRIVLLYCVRVLKLMFSPPRGKYDVLVAANHFLTDVLPAVYLKSRNSPCRLVAYYHGLPVDESSPSWLLPRKINDAISVSLLRRFFDVVFAINQPVKDFLISRGVEAQKIRITHNGIDSIPSEMTEMTAKGPVFDAFFVGRLVKSKGVSDLIRIWKGVCAVYPDAKLAIVGDGVEKNRLVKLIKNEGLDERITLCGYLQQERFAVMLRSKLFLLPSYAEAWPLVIVEAMSCGLPVIVYDLAALRNVWGNDIVYVPKGNEALFTKTIVSMLDDPELRSTLSQNGSRRSRDYLWGSIAQSELDSIASLS
jgi:glycosyltransferase involved in cell wall biosynthesis